MNNKCVMLVCILLTFSGGMLCGADALGTSEAELSALRRLNKTAQAVVRSDKELSSVMVGTWTTGRHDYIFRKDGTWQMLPITRGGTAGKWHIKNGQLFDGVATGRVFLRAEPDLLVLRNTQGTYPFRYVRLK